MRISASEFKKRFYAMLDGVESEGVVITRYGKPVAKLVPIPSNQRDLIGVLRGKINIMGNIDSAAVSWDSRP